MIGGQEVAEPDQEEGDQPSAKPRCERRGEAFEVHGRRGEERLDTHVLQATSDGTRQAVPGLGLAVEPFRAPAVALVEVRIALRPAFLPAAGAEQGGMVIADDHRLVGPSP